MDRSVTETDVAALMKEPSAKLPDPLPPIREDLRLFPAAVQPDGSPTWVIQDPISNVFYRLGWVEFELLSRWYLGSAAAILTATTAETPLEPALEELTLLYRFLLQNELLQIHDVRYTRDLVTRFRKLKGNRFRWLLHNYLFIRLPILHPTRALQEALRWLGWLFTPTTAFVVIALTLMGLALTARQWDVFVASFIDTLSPTGLVGYLIALAVTKSMHELGHALTATRYGVRVAHMGLAFVVLWPMLYTDTGEAWRLSSRYQRLAIASAGIVTEMAIAGLATLAWNLTGDGDLRQALFFVATTSWVLTLALNLSPFMRFDGYFILSDILDIPNLHERAFAVTRVALRNVLFGFHDLDPEPLSRTRRAGLILFALATWLYRLFVFVGIAVAVYLFFFKLLGIFLFGVEIVWFVLLPVWREVKVWHARRAEVNTRRKWVLGCIAGGLVVLAALPWSHQVRGQGYAHPARIHAFYSPLPAQLQEPPPPAGPVTAGQTLFVLYQPELAYKAWGTAESIHALERQLLGLSGWEGGEERRATLESQRAMRTAEIAAEFDETERLVLSAPFDGVLTDLDPELAQGVWVGTRDELGLLLAPGHWQAEVFVDQNHLARVPVGTTARFFPEGQALSPLTGRVIDVEQVRTATLPLDLLSTEFGGPILVIPNKNEQSTRQSPRHTPRDTLYRVRIDLDQVPPELRVLRGEGVIDGRPESLLMRVLRPLLIVLIREASF
jgi:putative peptide zinc metalloprotease protein